MSEDGALCGTFFMNGDVACAEGAISAGCRFFAGYPITPATEVAERMSERLPHVGGVYIQMEDEMASMNAVLGASWAGMKAMTANRVRSGTQPCSVFVTVLVILVFATALLILEETEFATLCASATALDADIADDDSDRHDEHDE